MFVVPTPPSSAKLEYPGFQYLASDNNSVPWSPSFAPDEKVDEGKAWTTGASPQLNLDDNGHPPWSTSRKVRRVSLQLSADAGHNLRMSPEKPYFPDQPKSLEGIALRSFCLGITLAFSVVATILTLVFTSSGLWRLPFFWAALSTFHFLEFWTTAKYNTREAKIESFLLTANWPLYAIAHASASLECFVANLFWPNLSWAPLYTGHILLLIGLILVSAGQVIRATSMMQLGSNFNHIVQNKKKTDHELVTTGIYGLMRHPSYFGFFWWGIGTQLVLGNPICFVGYTIVLWKFFSGRIRHEEMALTQFFSDGYVEYKERVPTRIPFIP